MKKYKFVNIIPVFLLVVAIALFINCSTDENTAPQNPVFTGVEKISIPDSVNTSSLNSSGSFTYTVPAGVVYTMVAFFHTTNNPMQVDGTSFTNTISIGSATFNPYNQKMTINTVYMDDLFEYNISTNTFISPAISGTGGDVADGNHTLVIVGFDSGGSVYAASPDFTVNITW